MLVIVGESASGKSSVEKVLVEKYGFQKIVSYTTRKPRIGEIDGIDYHFITRERFGELIAEGFFAEYAEYNGWYYGTAKEDCTSDKVAVLTPHGLRQMKNITFVISFYINVPRRDRLIKILQRGDNIEEAYRRNLTDVGMFDGIADEVTHVIDNEGYENSVEEMAYSIKMLYEMTN